MSVLEFGVWCPRVSDHEELCLPRSLTTATWSEGRPIDPEVRDAREDGYSAADEKDGWRGKCRCNWLKTKPSAVSLSLLFIHAFQIYVQ